MSLIKDFLKKLFGDDKKQAVTTLQSRDNYLARWEQERQERILAAEAKLKVWIITSLKKEKGDLPFSWESGNDEAFVTFEGKTDADEYNFEELEEYIVDKLDIPDAGEFQMNGKGTIYIENDFVRAKYSSAMKVTIDFNEETEEEIFSEEEYDSGDIVLFAVS